MVRRLMIAMAVGVASLVVLAGTAGAGHVRPKTASPIKVSLVPAFEPCVDPNRTHGPPLAEPSCNPPAPASSYVTVGTPDVNGAPPNFAGSVKLYSIAGTPGSPEDAGLGYAISISDVRCEPGTSTCANPNATGGPDYTGELQFDSDIRITDHWNAEDPGGGSDAATVIDLPFPIHLTCTNTADASTGAACSVSASTCLGCLWPPVREGKRTLVEIGQVRVIDGGSDGIVATGPNALFAAQGIFIP